MTLLLLLKHHLHGHHAVLHRLKSNKKCLLLEKSPALGLHSLSGDLVLFLRGVAADVIGLKSQELGTVVNNTIMVRWCRHDILPRVVAPCEIQVLQMLTALLVTEKYFERGHFVARGNFYVEIEALTQLKLINDTFTQLHR